MNSFEDFEQLYNEMKNRPIKERATGVYYDIFSTMPPFDIKNKEIFNTPEEFKNDIPEELNELQNLVDSTKPTTNINLNSSYILGINEDGIKFAQYSNNYLFDDLMEIKNFLESDNRKFCKNLKYLYFIDDKHKFKYVEKAKKRGKKTLYFDDSFGVKILRYINNEKLGIIGDKYGVQNCILDNINRNDNIQKKIIIILSFDVNLFEIYYSIPYNMHEKGSAELENELVYCCRLDEMEPNIVFDEINKNLEFFI